MICGVFVHLLCRDRYLSDKIMDEAVATKEWKDYDNEVVEEIEKYEMEWITNPEPITKETVAKRYKTYDAMVEHVQEKHEKKNELLIQQYKTFKAQIEAQKIPLITGRKIKKKRVKVRRPDISDEYASLIDKFY